MVGLMIIFSGSKMWWKNGLAHRVNGPAIDNVGGDKFWMQQNQLHRINGPAVTRSDNSVEYWVNGNIVTEFESMFISNQGFPNG